MSRILIPYGTTEGSTAKISEYMVDVIQAHGHEAHAVDLKASGHPQPEGYDGVIVGASIHMAKHEDYVVDFVRQNRDALERLPSAFFSVSLAAHGDREEAEGYIEVRGGYGLAARQGGPLRRRAAVHAVRFHKAPHDEEDRTRQSPGHRHLPRLRLHGVGRGEALRRRVPGGAGPRSRADLVRPG